jgi:hypothetical protein
VPDVDVVADIDIALDRRRRSGVDNAVVLDGRVLADPDLPQVTPDDGPRQTLEFSPISTSPTT